MVIAKVKFGDIAMQVLLVAMLIGRRVKG